jgi:hypothetical protein
MLSYTYLNGTLTITREDGYIVIFQYNPETLKPFNSEEQAIAYSQSTKLYFINPNPEIIVNPTALDNKNKARQLLLESDWVTLIDVTDTTTFPYLANQEDYLIYRAALRAIVVNPVAGDMIFPVKPTSVWVEGVI